MYLFFADALNAKTTFNFVSQSWVTKREIKGFYFSIGVVTQIYCEQDDDIHTLRF
jgi:hypothetical protein